MERMRSLYNEGIHSDAKGLDHQDRKIDDEVILDLSIKSNNKEINENATKHEIKSEITTFQEENVQDMFPEQIPNVGSTISVSCEAEPNEWFCENTQDNEQSNDVPTLKIIQKPVPIMKKKPPRKIVIKHEKSPEPVGSPIQIHKFQPLFVKPFIPECPGPGNEQIPDDYCSDSGNLRRISEICQRLPAVDLPSSTGSHDSDLGDHNKFVVQTEQYHKRPPIIKRKYSQYSRPSREKSRLRQRLRRATMTEEQLKEEREKEAARRRLQRAAMTPEEKQAFRAANAAQQRKYRAAMTPEQRQAMREKSAASVRKRRAMMTPEQKEAMKRVQTERTRRARAEKAFARSCEALVNMEFTTVYLQM